MGKKDEFLSNGSNKQQLINVISLRLKEKGCTVTNTTGDADYDIVQAAVEASQLQSTTLIGEDTHLLILLLHQDTAGPEQSVSHKQTEEPLGVPGIYHDAVCTCLHWV